MRSPSLRRVLATCAGIGFCVLSSTAHPKSFNTLHTFDGSSEGDSPQSELTQGTDLKLYGTNSADGPNGNGSVFSITTGGTFLSLSSFGPISEGIKPIGGLVQASDGNFYGTTYGGGDNALGTLFQITAGGDLTLLAVFNSGAPGANPVGTLVQGLDGNLYGTAQTGGVDNFGTVFRTDLAGDSLTTLSDFTAGTDGLYPESDLVQASNGLFYGTTTRGGAADAGTIFSLDSNGVRTIIHSFDGNTDGREPLRGVVVGRDGGLYGIARLAGVNGAGTIYRITTDGTFTALYSFSPISPSPYFSYGRLCLASDGNFYGTTNLGGAFSAGTIFEITPTGGFTEIYDFTSGTDGGYPKGGLVQGTDGNFYGTTSGLNGQSSTVFQLDLDLAKPTPQPIAITSGTTVAGGAVTVKAGDTVLIKGDYFLGVNAVTFPKTGGAVPAASFTVLSKTLLQAVVPVGAISGVVTVANGTLSASTPLGLTVTVDTGGGGGGGGGGGTGGGGTTKPVVTVRATDAVANESGDNTGRFKFKRKGGDLTKALTIVVKVQGTATRGVDYTLSNRGQVLPTVTNSVTIPANKVSTVVTVNVIDDNVPELDERVVIKLKGGADYTVGSPRKAVVVIADND